MEKLIKRFVVMIVALLVTVSISAQHKVTGLVATKSGERLIGVAVVEKGTQNVATTNENGEYSIVVSAPDSFLECIYIGCKNKIVAVNGSSVINIELEENITQLNDVVVIGYGATTKKELTGSVASVKSDDFVTGNISSPYDLMQGKIAGLNIIRSGGADPNGEFSISLRGTTTMSAGAQPLIIIDDVIGGSLDSIDPEEIESIDVLKDGSAAAIYGTRGTNGVILITTKKGSGNEVVNVDFSTYVGVQTILREPDMLTAQEFREVIAAGHSGSDAGASTDWMKEITRKLPVTQYYSLAVSGSAKKLSYRASVSYHNDEGLVLKSGNQTLRGKLNLTQTAIKDRLTLNYNFNYSSAKSNPTDYWIVQQAVRRNPTEPVYDLEDKEHGGYFFNGAPFEYYNPVAMLEESDRESRTRTFMGSIKATLKIIDGLKLSALGSFAQMSQTENDYYGRYYPQNIGYDGIASVANKWSIDKLLEINANYNKKIKDHSVQAVLGYSYSDNVWEYSYMSNYGFDTDYFKWNNIGTGSALLNGKADMSSVKESAKLIAFFGRVMYNYKEKYLASVSARYEGSSRFGKNHKWGLFPAVSLGWRINEEPFLKRVSWIDELKLRVGYGVTGNQEISNYESLARLTTSGKFFYNGKWINTYGPASNDNDDLRWERKSEFNVGLDFEFFKGRLGGTIDYYNRTTSDLLYTYSVPVPPNLYNTKFTNVGVIKNTGVEVTVRGVPVMTKAFSWNSSLTLAHNKNLLKSFSNEDYAMQYLDEGYIDTDFKQYVQRIYEGSPIGNFFGPVFMGMDHDGKAMYEGVNPGEAVSESVYKVIGNAYPDLTLGWSNSFQYKNWNLSFLLRASIGNDVANIQRLFYEGYYYFGSKNILHSTLDSPNNAGQTTWSSHFVEDGSFLKLSNLSLSYTFKPKVDWMNSLKVYLTGQNLFCLTKYKGVDPEVNLNGLAPGIAWDEFYPTTRMFVLGLNLSF